MKAELNQAPLQPALPVTPAAVRCSLGGGSPLNGDVMNAAQPTPSACVERHLYPRSRQ
jgi:hypothetical protein